MPRHLPAFLFVCAAVVSEGPRAVADTIYVDARAAGPVHDGTSWCAGFVHLQDAIAAASLSDTIRVAAGTHRPDHGVGQVAGDRAASFRLAGGVTLLGGFAGCTAADPDERNVARHETILHGDLNDDDQPGLLHNEENSYHVVRGEFNGATAVLDGFTIVGGNANGGDLHNRGGGLFLTSGQADIRDCTFRGNWGRFGGAINSDGSGLNVMNTVFDGNVAGFSGGAMRCWDTSLSIHNCLFVANRAEAGGGAWIGASTAFLGNCTFSDNAAFAGSALAFDSCCPQQPSGFEAVNCILWNSGGEIANDDGSSVFVGFSAVAGGSSGFGNIADDPLFVPGPAGCHYLSHSAAGNVQNSPAIDAGADAAATFGFEMRTTRRDEIGDAGTADMGYHYPMTARPFLMGDWNRSTRVDLRDLAILQACFTGEGPLDVPPCCRIFDFDEDADIDLIDAEAFHNVLTGP